MSLHDPLAAFNAATNLEAHLVRALLNDANIPAIVIEDATQAATWWWLGPLTEIYKPQVWIERADLERAQSVLLDYERRNAERRSVEQHRQENTARFTVTCDACETPSAFSTALRGTVQHCPHCGSYVDVGDDVTVTGWDTESEA